MSHLAIKGGKKVRSAYFPSYNSIGLAEKKAVAKVLDSGALSKFLGTWHEYFYGGPEINKLEKDWAKFYKVKHAVAVNSATSALYCAVGAIGVGPGDEIIVSPYTMSASAIAPLIYNAIPVFADIEEEYFCLSPKSIEERITKYTKAIIVVDIFGQPYNREAINAIAKKNGLYVIEDAAQAPGALYKGRLAGTLGDIGIHSLNYHKHIHCGEGGIIVTNNDVLAERVRLIRNHAEAVVENKKTHPIVDLLGFNYRMTEVEAAIARTQLKRLPNLLAKRLKNVQYLTAKLNTIPCLRSTKVRAGCQHVFYVQPLIYDEKISGIPRDRFVDAVAAELTSTKLRAKEGKGLGKGYVKPLYLEPIYQQKIAYGEKGCPWRCLFYKGKVSYQKGICPVAEKMHYQQLIIHDLIHNSMTTKDLDDVYKAFQKVWQYRQELL